MRAASAVRAGFSSRLATHPVGVMPGDGVDPLALRGIFDCHRLSQRGDRALGGAIASRPLVPMITTIEDALISEAPPAAIMCGIA